MIRMSCRPLLLVLLCAALCACGQTRVKAGQSARGISPIATDAPENYIPHQTEYGAAVECPVCRKGFTVKEGTPASRCEGSTYYFCCPQCEEQFQVCPSSYTK